MFESFRDIQRIAGGFQAAKIFLTANDLGLFLEIGSGTKTVEDLATGLQVDERALGLLLNALVGLGFLGKEEDGYRNRPVVLESLGQPESYRGSIFKHIHHCWESWSRLPDVIRSGSPEFAAEENALGANDEWTRDFIEGMNDVTRDLAPQVVPQLGLENAKTLLDAGGGSGTYAAAFLQAWPNLDEVRIFDLPDALEIGRKRLRGLELDSQVVYSAGDFATDALPEGNDAIWLSQVLHSHDEAECQTLIAKAFKALNRGGRLLVHEFLLDEGKTSPPLAAVFAVHMLVMTAGGRTYSGAEIGGWMEEAGLFDIEIINVSPDTAVIAGKKP